MPNPIGTMASAVSLVETASKGWKWFTKRTQSSKSPVKPFTLAPPHDGVAIRPLHFEISLGDPLPFIELEFYAINYTNKSARLTSAQITRFCLSSGPAIDTIPLRVECDIPPQQSKIVLFRRALTDGEVRAIEANNNPVSDGTVSFLAHAKVGRNELQYGPEHGIRIWGHSRGTN